MLEVLGGDIPQEKESQSYYYPALKLSTVPGSTVNTVETSVLRPSSGDVSCMKIFLCTLSANIQHRGISHSWALSEQENVFKGMEENIASIIIHLWSS